MTGPNLSEWALGHRSLIVFLMLVCGAAGVLSYQKLGRSEDPPFTIKTMIVKVRLARRDHDRDPQPGHRPDREEARRDARRSIILRSYTKPGESVVFVNLKDTTPPKDVPDIWYQVRKKVQRHHRDASGRRAGPVLQRRVRRHLQRGLRLHQRRLQRTRAEGLCREGARAAPARAGREQGRPRRRAGRENLRRVLAPPDLQHGNRAVRRAPCPAGAEQRGAGGHLHDRSGTHPDFRQRRFRR